MMQNRTERILHAVVFLTTALAIAYYFWGGPDVLGSTGTMCFRYFTTDSNVLAAIASMLCLIYPNSQKRPRAVTVFRFVATVSVTITLMTVICFLVPVAYFRSHKIATVLRFYQGNVLVLHLTTPIFSIWAFLRSKDRVTKREAFWALAPVIIYSVVYLVMVVFLKFWRDWYGFTFGGKYWLSPLVMVIMYSVTLLIAQTIRLIHESVLRKHSEL